MSEERETVTITVNGEPVVAEKGELVIAAAERAGTYIPHFCYHPRMASVGMCRMCIVDIDTGRGPALQPACMIEVAPDMVVDTHSEATKKAQDGVLEFLLINHPLDCPVCDKGGECPLQDQTIAYGPGESRFVEEKRHFAKPIPISDLVLPRPGALHPVRPLHPLRQGGGRRPADLLHRTGATRPRSTPSPTTRSPPTSAATRCRSARWAPSPPRPTASGPGPGTSTRSSRPARRCSVGCRVAVQSSRNRGAALPAGSTSTRSTGAGCATRAASTSSPSTAPTAWASPLVRDAGRQWPHDGPLDRGPAAGPPRPSQGSTAAAPTRSAVIGGARLTNEAAYAWAKLRQGRDRHRQRRRPAGRRPARRGGARACPGPRSTRPAPPGGTWSCWAPTSRRSCRSCTCGCATPRSNDGVRIVELAPAATGLDGPVTPPTAARYAAGRAGRHAGPPSPSARCDAAARPRASGPVVVPSLGRAGAGRGRRPDRRRWPPAPSTAVARGPVPAPLCAAATSTAPSTWAWPLASCPAGSPLDGGARGLAERWPTVPASAGLDTAGDPAGRGRRQDRRARAARRRSAGRLPRPRPGPPGARGGAGTVIAVDLLPHRARSSAADVVLPAAGYAEVDGTTTNLEGRVSTRRPEGHPAGHGPGRLDHRRRSRRPPRVRPGRRVGRGPAGRDRSAVAPAHAGLAGDRAGRGGPAATASLVDAARPVTAAPAVTDRATCRRRTSYSLRLVSGRTHATTEATLVQRALDASPSWLAPADGRDLQPRTTSTGSASSPATPVKVTSARGYVTVSAAADPGVPRASAVSCRSTCPGGAGGDADQRRRRRDRRAGGATVMRCALTDPAPRPATSGGRRPHRPARRSWSPSCFLLVAVHAA